MRIIRFLVWMIVILFGASVVPAAGLEWVLAPPREPLKGGDVAILALYLHNPTDAAIVHELPSTLPCRIDAGSATVNTTGELVDAPGNRSTVDISGRGYACRQYAVPLPVAFVGAVTLTFPTLDVNPVMVMVENAPAGAWDATKVSLDEDPALSNAFLDALSVYKPMYFLLGVDPGLDQSKFQFSFKYRLFNPNGYLAKKASWITGFHIGYTQRSIWDLKSDSKPFEDTSYMPEVFYLLPKIDLDHHRVDAFGIQGGFQHESNGKGGTDSRSTNYLYFQPTLRLRLGDTAQLKLSPKIFTYVANEDENNGDLDEYRGYFVLETGISDPKGLALDSYLWWAAKGASIQLDLTCPMTLLFGRNLNMYLQAQYFSGYAETLIHYDKRRDVFRLGFSIVR